MPKFCKTKGKKLAMSNRWDKGKSNPPGFSWDVSGWDLESVTSTAP